MFRKTTEWGKTTKTGNLLVQINGFKSLNLAVLAIFSGIVILLIPTTIIAKEVSSTQPGINTLFDRAERAYLSGNYEEAISLWSKIITEPKVKSQQLAAVYANLASLFWQKGNPGEAIPYWQKAIAIYRKDNSPANLAATLTDTARAYNDLGQPRFAIPLLAEALTISDRLKLIEVKNVAYLALGNARTIEGDYSSAIVAYKKSIANIGRLREELPIVLWNNLSKAYEQQALVTEQRAIAVENEGLVADELWQQGRRDRAMAVKAANKAVEIGSNSQSLARAEALIQIAKLAENQKSSDSESIEQAAAIFNNLPDSVAKVYALINFARVNNSTNIESVLNSAIEIAQKLDNPRVVSFATGEIGKYYESQQQYEKALYWTRQAQLAAEGIPDSQYRWDWQAARIYQQTGNNIAAMKSYENAIASLQLIRSDLAKDRGNYQLNFQNDIEPVYRSLMELLLSDEASPSNSQQALQIKDLLQLSELENFFQDDCFELKTATEADRLAYLKESNAAIVNTIILDEQTYLIWQLPNGKTQKYAIDISQTELENIVTQWRYDLENKANDNYLNLSQQLYQLLFPPELRTQLATIQPQNLIFVNDGILRNVPMAALHDGQKFLVENYGVSNSLGLNIRIEQSTPMVERAIAFGLTLATEAFPPLPYVKVEIEKLDNFVANEQFLNNKFNYQNFKQEIESSKSSLVHIATHGQFGGTAENTFLQAYRSRISLFQLEEILSNHNNNFPDTPIQMLVLSACDTASSNPRATLGMSGVAVRSGVGNILGSLWAVNDREIVSLIDGFYRYWIEDKLNRSEALRQAQLDLIGSFDPHPSNWSSMILIQ